jgi:signal transduction histidine kinase
MPFSSQLKDFARSLYWQYAPGSKRVTVGFILALSLMAGLSIASYQNATQLTADSTQVDQAYQTLDLLNAIATDLTDAESARRGYFLFQDPAERQRYTQAVRSLRLKLANLKSMQSSSGNDQTFESLERLIAQQLDLFQQSIAAFEQRQIELAAEDPLLLKPRQNRQVLNQQFAALRAQEQQLIQQQRTVGQKNLRSRLFIEWIGNVLTFFILLGVYILLRHQKLRRQNAEARQRQMAQRNELNELKLQFFSLLSHEFRTPLSLITGSAHLLKESLKFVMEPQHLKNLHRIQSAAKLINQQLNDLLTVARADAGRMEFNPVPLEMQTFCLNLIEDFQAFSDTQRTIQFTKRGQSTHAMVDEKLLYSILSNLLSNALKYSDPQSTVYFLMICESYAVTFQIRDEGVGISLEDQQTLYELFSRGKNVQDRAGSGLGLAVVKRCVDLHQGRITVESQVGDGTTVTVKLSNLGYLN